MNTADSMTAIGLSDFKFASMKECIIDGVI